MKQGSLVTSTLIFGILTLSAVNAAQNYSYTINSIENQANYNHGIMYSGVEEYENFDESYGYEMNDIDAKLTVRSIGLKLKRNAKINKKVYFKYSKELDENAKTKLDGTITVYRGILDYCEHEDELAFIIARELAHATNYHLIKKAGVNYAGTTIGSIAGSTAVDILINVTEKKVSREYEESADTIAIDYLVQSGYNPLAGISLIYKTSDISQDFFSTQQSADTRVKNLYNYINSKYPQYIPKGFETRAYQLAIKEVLD